MPPKNVQRRAAQRGVSQANPKSPSPIDFPTARNVEVAFGLHSSEWDAAFAEWTNRSHSEFTEEQLREVITRKFDVVTVPIPLLRLDVLVVANMLAAPGENDKSPLKEVVERLLGCDFDAVGSLIRICGLTQPNEGCSDAQLKTLIGLALIALRYILMVHEPDVESSNEKVLAPLLQVLRNHKSNNAIICHCCRAIGQFSDICVEFCRQVHESPFPMVIKTVWVAVEATDKVDTLAKVCSFVTALLGRTPPSLGAARHYFPLINNMLRHKGHIKQCALFCLLLGIRGNVMLTGARDEPRLVNLVPAIEDSSSLTVTELHLLHRIFSVRATYHKNVPPKVIEKVVELVRHSRDTPVLSTACAVMLQVWDEGSAEQRAALLQRSPQLAVGLMRCAHQPDLTLKLVAPATIANLLDQSCSDVVDVALATGILELTMNISHEAVNIQVCSLRLLVALLEIDCRSWIALLPEFIQDQHPQLLTSLEAMVGGNSSDPRCGIIAANLLEGVSVAIQM